MSRMKSIFGMYALAALAMGGGLNHHGSRYIEPKETEEERNKRLAKAEIERYKAQGLTQFFYGANSLWALNQKSADKKARKRNWI